MTQLDDDRLHAVLVSVGDHLRVDAAPHEARRSAVAWAPTRLRWAAAAVVIVVAVSFVAAPVRRTVADWLGLGSTSVEVDPDGASATASLESIAVGLEPVSEDEAAVLIGQPVPELDGTDLGAPSGLARMPEGGVLVVWPSASTLWVRDADVELPIRMKKMITTLDHAVAVSGLGEEALVITGDHMLVTPHRRLAATAVVLWRSGGLELRLEADLSADELVGLARAIEDDR